MLVAALRSILSGAPLAPLVDRELFPGADVQSDEEWLGFARQYGNSSYLWSPPQRWGPRAIRWRWSTIGSACMGWTGYAWSMLRIMPAIPSANTYAATMMVAEKASDMILADA